MIAHCIRLIFGRFPRGLDTAPLRRSDVYDAKNTTKVSLPELTPCVDGHTQSVSQYRSIMRPTIAAAFSVALIRQSVRFVPPFSRNRKAAETF